jgi:phosphatidylserine/phosphatidylglycerophosphate/cardiolipin synthase-like enzyme
VAERARAGVDVKLITSEFQTTDLIEQLMDAGIDSALLRIQPHVHNKGMVVDSRHIVISSQNWSSAGTLRNRDAGIILYDNEDAAKYFEEIFLHDWAHMASSQVVH